MCPVGVVQVVQPSGWWVTDQRGLFDLVVMSASGGPG